MAYTQSSAFSGLLAQSVQRKALKNLRDQLVWANPRWAEEGTFDAVSDKITFYRIPDLSITTALTPLTEGQPPTERAITTSAVTVSTAEYGDLVGLTNVAKLKGPAAVVEEATERVVRVGKEVIDRITRDAIFLGGTAFYVNTETSRAGLDNNDHVVGADLQKLYSTMRKNKVPMLPDNSYLLLCSEEVAYDIKRDTTDDTGWLDVNKYDRPDGIINGEIGKFHGFRIIPTTTNPTFSSTVTVHASLAIGAIKGWGAGTLETFKTYHVPPGGDHDDPLAQKELMGWRVNFGVATLSNDYYYRMESFASTL